MTILPPRSAAGGIVAIVLVVVASFVLLGRGTSLALSKTSPELALRFYGSDPEALVRINESERDAVAKTRRARLVLAQRPMDGRAYRQLAEVEQEKGRTQAATALFRLALRYTPRDRLSQAWIADYAVSRGRMAEAMRRVILLVDMDATLWDGLFPHLRKLSLHDGARSLLIAKMATEPPWRSQFLAAWEQDAPASFDAVMLELTGADASFTAAERELWVLHLVRRHRWTAAYLAWVDGLEPNRKPTTLGVSNHGFEWAPAGYFDWSLAPGGGNRKALVSTSGATGERALRVEFTGQPGTSVQQVLVLLPGPYVFKARTRLEDLRSERGLVWRVRCVNDQTLLASGPIMNDSSHWYSYGFRFDVPPGCLAQHLSLEPQGSWALERRMEGVAWFDEVLITAVSNTATLAPQSGAQVSDQWSSSSAGASAAILLIATPGARIERAGTSMTAVAGALLLDGDRVTTDSSGKVVLLWRDECQTMVPMADITLRSPCPAPPTSRMSPVLPGVADIVRVSLAADPRARGSTGADVPVGP